MRIQMYVNSVCIDKHCNVPRISLQFTRSDSHQVVKCWRRCTVVWKCAHAIVREPNWRERRKKNNRDRSLVEEVSIPGWWISLLLWYVYSYTFNCCCSVCVKYLARLNLMFFVLRFVKRKFIVGVLIINTVFAHRSLYLIWILCLLFFVFRFLCSVFAL